MYCKGILYPVAVYDETTLFDNMKENIPRCHISDFVFFLFQFIKSNLAPSWEASSGVTCT